MSIAIIKGSSAIEKAIASIASRGKKLDADIQTAALSVLSHASDCGDTTLCDRLIDALPKGARKLALVEWMLAFGQVRVLKKDNPDDAARIKAGAHVAYDKTKTLQLEAGAEKPWYEFKKEPDIATAFDAQAAVSQVLTKLRKANENGLEIENKAHALEAARQLVAALGGASDELGLDE